MTDEPSRHAALLALAERYRALADENYARIRALAEAIQSGFCGYLNSADPPCVLLVPPTGPFEPIAYGDRAFSSPPHGFRPLGPIQFGLAVRVGAENEWLRVTLSCEKEGETFTVNLMGGGSHEFALPLKGQDPTEFFAALHAHVRSFFETAIDDYEHGRYGQRDMGFDFSAAMKSDAPTSRGEGG
jgi:hypothetical protein